jgi:hypothetical protein
VILMGIPTDNVRKTLTTSGGQLTQP